jgi:uncharacterized protein (TIGR03437 family)
MGQQSAAQIITTVAGTDWLFPGDGRLAKDAPLSGLGNFAITVDQAGIPYIADTDSAMVLRVTSDGIIHSFAGNGYNLKSGDGGLAVNAGITPAGIALDSQGNLYITDLDQIRKVTPDGIISTLAGNRTQGGSSGDGGPAIQALLNFPLGIAADVSGNIFFCDALNNKIRKISTNGIITTIAGTGQQGISSDNISALSARIDEPNNIAVDAQGNVFFVEGAATGNLRLRKVDSTGIITTVAGRGTKEADGIPAAEALVLPTAVTVGPTGELFIIDAGSGAVRKIDKNGIITTVAGGTSEIYGFSGDGGPALKAVFRFVTGAVVVDASGVIYVGDDGNGRIRSITTDGVVNTLAGNGLYRFSGDGGPAVSATLNDPFGIVGDGHGNLYLTESQGNLIRRIAQDGTISVYAGNHFIGFPVSSGKATTVPLGFPEFLTLSPTGAVTFANSCDIQSIDANGMISIVAGGGGCLDSGDNGPAVGAGISTPYGLTYDGAGNLILSEPDANTLRIVFAPPDGRIFTLAGNGTAGFSGDGGNAGNAQLNNPSGMRYHNGGLYFADSGNNRIRRIDAKSLVITTVAGNGNDDYTGDGGAATKAALCNPQNLEFDSAGNMYIADTGNGVVRKVDVNGVITTFVGSVKARTRGDGGPALNAELMGPTDIYIDPSGVMYIVDEFDNRVRAVLLNAPDYAISSNLLSFTAPAGSTTVSQRVDLTSSITGLAFNVSSTAPWISVSPSSGNLPAEVTVTVDPSSLNPGLNEGTLYFTVPNARVPSQATRVDLTVTAAGQPSLSVKPGSVTSYTTLNALAITKSITISNAGGGSLKFLATTATNSSQQWLALVTSSGTLGAFGSQSIAAVLNPAGLAPGTYSGTISIASTNLTPAQTLTVPVTMTVTQVQQTILIPQTGLTFYAVAGGGVPPPQFFSVLNAGSGQMPFSTSVSTLTGGNWLTVFPNAGTSDASSTLVPQIRLDVNPAGLAAGIYYGSASVTASTAANSPEIVSVILNLLPAGSSLGPIVEPSGLIFVSTSGGDSPGSQPVIIQSTSASPVTFTSGVTTVNGGNWLSALPPQGTVAQAQPARVVLQPDSSQLGAGVYRGTLTLSFSDGTVRVVAVVLVVAPAGTVPSVGGGKGREAGGCIPTVLVPIFTQLSAGFTETAGFPGQVSVDVVDDCGASTTTGDVIVGFSNGDPPLRLTSLKDGNWAGTWTPQRVVSPITVTADAVIPDRNLKGEVVLTGSLQTAASTPILSSGAVLNGASFAAQSPVAPGTFVSLFGSQLASGTAVAPSVPLPVTLAGGSVLLAGQQIPIFSANTGQLNAILPYGLAVNTTLQVLVSQGNSLSVPQAITIAPASPGVFTTGGTGQGQGIILGVAPDGSQTLADSNHPVSAGQTIVIYCTGLGEVTPSMTAGNQTPLSPLFPAINPVSVTVGGLNADVAFAGLTPGQTGLYQVNAVVPSGVNPSSQVAVILTAAGQQSSPVGIAVH